MKKNTVIEARQALEKYLIANAPSKRYMLNIWNYIMLLVVQSVKKPTTDTENSIREILKEIAPIIKTYKKGETS